MIPERTSLRRLDAFEGEAIDTKAASAESLGKAAAESRAQTVGSIDGGNDE